MANIEFKLRDIMGNESSYIEGVESFAILSIFTMSTVGYPLYLLMGASAGPSRGKTSHFIVPNKMFPPHVLLKVHISTLGICGVFYFLYLWAQQTSFAEVLAVYIGPYMVVNAWISLITYLQHTDAEVPHYDETAWTWVKGTLKNLNFTGALGTIDRNYPPFIDALHHYIGTTHVLHHLFSDLPHYNAKEAHVYLK
jgi:omega-6 fatty acid desaturase (delta-12 desaturase)